ncbi:MAG: PDZ domain-containing protein [Chloroflexi bacterium]|nr:PDZ domain-containing protein [Chloroflexota bacterium]MCL5275098.1 PDZ domain-containing protein [Chloroflexota bacterium]
MTSTTSTAAPVAAGSRAVKHTLLRVARLGVVALAVLLVGMGIPLYYNSAHIAPLAGVYVAASKAGDAVFTFVVSNTPTSQAGVRPGDVLVAVNGQPVAAGLSAYQFYQLTSGWVNTPVTLTVRTAAAAPRTVAVNRSADPTSVVARVQPLGVTVDFIIGFPLFLDLVVLLSYLSVAAVLIWRGRDLGFIYFASLALVAFGAAGTRSLQVLAHELSLWGWLANALMSAGYAAIFIFFGFRFPDGKWVPRRGRILAGIVLVWTLLQWVWLPARPMNWDPLLAALAYLAMIVAMFIAQLRRYRRVATPAQRGQIKWFVLAVSTIVAGYAISQIVSIVIYYLGSYLTRAADMVILLLWLASVLFYQVPYILLAVAIGLALLRYRLWDIDVVINRSLVYSALTAALAVLSAISLAAVNSLVGQLFSGVSPFLVVAISAAFPVAAFNPLRGWIQRMVDRSLKPEEMSFSETYAFLALEVQAMLGPAELLHMLVIDVTRQLDLISAGVYLCAPDDRLMLTERAIQDVGTELPPELALEAPMKTELHAGNVMAPPDGMGLSLLVPLVVGTRALDLCGVLALGPRRSGKGYTTPVQRGLKELGKEAGKSIYVAQRSQSSLQHIAERLSALEQRIAGLKQG